MAIFLHLPDDYVHDDNTVPEILYKFLTINKYTLELLIKKQIFMPAPQMLNDPFDCFIPIRYDLEYPEECAPADTAVKKNDRRSKDAHGRDIMYDANEMTEFDLSELRRNVRIFSMTSERDNFLLWSHYANNHAGVSIGFSVPTLRYNTASAVGQVTYYEDLPQMRPGEVDKSTEVKRRVLTKAKCWQYEKEYRLIYFQPKSLFDIEPKAIREITFGCRTSDTDIRSICKLIETDSSFSHVRMFKATKELYSFKLKIEEFNPSQIPTGNALFDVDRPRLDFAGQRS